MKFKSVVILSIVMAVAGAALFAFLQFRNEDQPDRELGAYFLEGLPANKINSIEIKSKDGAVSLKKSDSEWVVTDRYNYPAQFSKISGLVRKLKDLKVGRRFEASEGSLERLSLYSPDDPQAPDKAEGTRIELKDEKGNLLSGIVLGKVRKSGPDRNISDGHYVIRDGAPDIYLVDKHFEYLDKAPSEWLEKELVKVEQKDIKEIVCLDNKKVLFSLRKQKEGEDFRLSPMRKGEKVKEQAVKRLSTAISSLRLEDVADPGLPLKDTGIDETPDLEFRLFNGMVYRLLPGKSVADEDGFYLRIVVSCQKKPVTENKATGDKGSEEEGAEAEKLEEDTLPRSEQLRKRFSPWTFKISKWQYESFITEKDELFETPEDKKKEGA